MSDQGHLVGKNKSKRGITRLDIEPSKSDERHANLKLYFADRDKRNAFVGAVSKSRNKAMILMSCRQVLRGLQPLRLRGNILQPLIPAEVNEWLRTAMDEAKTKNVNAFIRKKMERWIDFGQGERRRKKDGKFAFFPIYQLKRMGREWGQREGTVRPQLDMGEAAAAVRELIQKTTLTHSQFFCAVIEYFCAPTGTETDGQ